MMYLAYVAGNAAKPMEFSIAVLCGGYSPQEADDMLVKPVTRSAPPKDDALLDANLESRGYRRTSEWCWSDDAWTAQVTRPRGDDL